MVQTAAQKAAAKAKRDLKKAAAGNGNGKTENKAGKVKPPPDTSALSSFAPVKATDQQILENAEFFSPQVVQKALGRAEANDLAEIQNAILQQPQAAQAQQFQIPFGSAPQPQQQPEPMAQFMNQLGPAGQDQDEVVTRRRMTQLEKEANNWLKTPDEEINPRNINAFLLKPGVSRDVPPATLKLLRLKRGRALTRVTAGKRYEGIRERTKAAGQKFPEVGEPYGYTVPKTFRTAGTDAGQTRYGETLWAANTTEDQILNRAKDGYRGHGSYFGDLVDAGEDLIGGGAYYDPRTSNSGNLIGSGAYWGNRIGRMIPYVGHLAGPALSGLEDMAIRRGIKYAGDYVGSGAYDDGSFRGEDGGLQLQREQPRVHFDESSSQYFPSMEDAVRDINIISTPFAGKAYNQLVEPGSEFSRRPPRMCTVDDETGRIVFSHTEYLADIIPTAAGFQNQALLAVNAGLYTTFPMLSRFSAYFEEYRFTKIVVKYKSLVTEGNQAAAGSILLTFISNPMSASFSTKRSMENSANTVSGKVTDKLVMGVECEPDKNALGSGTLFTRYGNLPNGTNLQTYDYGLIQVVTQGAAPNLAIGELWVEYECELGKLRDVSQLPLQLGEGFSLELGPTGTLNGSAASAPASVYGPFLGSTPLASGSATPALVPVTFPLPDWSQSAVATFPNVQGYDWFTASQIPVVSYSQSPNLQLAISPSVLPQVGQNMTLTFNAVPQGTYLFRMALRVLTISTNTSLVAGTITGFGYNVGVVAGNATVSNAVQNFTAQPPTNSTAAIGTSVVQDLFAGTLVTVSGTGGQVVLLVTTSTGWPGTVNATTAPLATSIMTSFHRFS